VITYLQCAEKLAFGDVISLITKTAVCKFVMEISLSLTKLDVSDSIISKWNFVRNFSVVDALE